VAVAATIGALGVAAPVSGAEAATWPTGWTWPTGFSFPGGGVLGGTQTGVSTSGCGTNTPSVNGATGGATATTCGDLLSFVGPAIGQISTVVGPTIIGSTVLAPVNVSSGAIVSSGP
jgi:hypothetical protein